MKVSKVFITILVVCALSVTSLTEYYLKKVDAAETKYASIVNGVGLNVRLRASNTSPILVTVTPEEQLFILEDSDENWIKISTFDDIIGYVKRDNVAITTYKEVTSEVAKTRADELISMAEVYIGTPYVWGGNSLTKGVDCSGFTKAMYAMFGINLPRTAHLQSQISEPIYREDLQKGDLLFFGTDERITHVAIYIENDIFIHSGSSDGGIQKNNLNGDYYTRNFHHAVRVFE